jgi:hypothetical protein
MRFLALLLAKANSRPEAKKNHRKLIVIRTDQPTGTWFGPVCGEKDKGGESLSTLSYPLVREAASFG